MYVVRASAPGLPLLYWKEAENRWVRDVAHASHYRQRAWAVLERNALLESGRPASAGRKQDWTTRREEDALLRQVLEVVEIS